MNIYVLQRQKAGTFEIVTTRTLQNECMNNIYTISNLVLNLDTMYIFLISQIHITTLFSGVPILLIK